MADSHITRPLFSTGFIGVSGSGEIQLVGPRGGRLWAANGRVIQSDFSGVGDILPGPGLTQIYLNGPPNGVWRLRVVPDKDGLLSIQVFGGANDHCRGTSDTLP